MIYALSPWVVAHMEMVDPPPYRSKSNPKVLHDNIDYSMTAPLKADGSDYPCKGYQVDFDTPSGNPVGFATAGQTSSLRIEGYASHLGGSCQVSLSFDHGKTFRVIKSFIGNCVRVTSTGPDPDQNYEFTVPSDAKSGNVIIAWTWFNRSGNREMYMNCATITISGGGTSTLDSYPENFQCNIGNGCKILEGVDVVFPNPGNDVKYTAGNYGNSTSVDPVYTSQDMAMPEGSRIAVGVFMGLGAGVIVGLLGYYGWNWHKGRSTGAGTPTKA